MSLHWLTAVLAQRSAAFVTWNTSMKHQSQRLIIKLTIIPKAKKFSIQLSLWSTASVWTQAGIRAWCSDTVLAGRLSVKLWLHAYLTPKISRVWILWQFCLNQQETFRNKQQVFKGKPKFPTEISQWKMYLPFAIFHHHHGIMIKLDSSESLLIGKHFFASKW